MITQETQLEINFPNPFELQDFREKILRSTETQYVKLISQPKFHWISGQWRALAQVNDSLCVISLMIVHEKINNKEEKS